MQKANKLYPFWHWIFSIFVGAILTVIVALNIKNTKSLFNFNSTSDIFFYLFISMAFGFLFSIPAFLLYAIIFNTVVKKINNILLIKIVAAVLISVLVIIIFKIVTFLDEPIFYFSYIVPTIIGAFIFSPLVKMQQHTAIVFDAEINEQ